jgi:tetratricopeptide (TPR) repeat protein
LELALSEFQQARDARGIAATKDDLGNVLWLLGDRSRALPLLSSAYEERRNVGDERSIAVSLANLALVWHEQGRSDRSEQALGIANDLFGRSDDLGGRCDTLMTLGRVAFQRHDVRRALRLFQEATELAYRAKDRPRLARGLVQLGVAQLRNDDLAGAEALLTRARDLAIGIESWLDLAEAERALAKVALKRGFVREARQHASTALRLARRVRSRAQLSATLRTFARVVAETPHSSSCDHRIVGYFMRAIELAKQTGNDLELAKGYRALATYTARYEDPEIKHQTDVLRELSDEIFKRYDSQPAACA